MGLCVELTHINEYTCVCVCVCVCPLYILTKANQTTFITNGIQTCSFFRLMWRNYPLYYRDRHNNIERPGLVLCVKGWGSFGGEKLTGTK